MSAEPPRSAPTLEGSAGASASAAARAAPGASASALASASACGATVAWTADEAFAVQPALGNKTPCDALRAVFADYDEGAGAAPSAGGAVRAHRFFEVKRGPDKLVAMTFYVEPDAKESMLCGCCEGKAQLALLRDDGAKLSLVARSGAPLVHGGVGSGVDPVAGEVGELVLVTTHHGCGTAPGRVLLHGLRVTDTKIEAVLEARFAAFGSGPQGEPIHEEAVLSTKPGAAALPDVVLSWSRARCDFVDDKEVCEPGTALGSDTWVFDGKRYAQRGPRPKLNFF